METDRWDMCQWLMIIIDETVHEEETTQPGKRDTKRVLMERRLEGRRDGERRKSFYSAAVID